MSELTKTLIEVARNGIEMTEHYADGSVILKNIGVNEFRNKISRTSALNSGLLPPGTRYYEKGNRRELVVMETPEMIFDVTFYDSNDADNDEDYESKEYKIPVPKSLWMIYLEEKNGQKHHAESFLFAMKEPLLSEKTMLYRFPFSNVSDWICWGDIILPKWQNLIGLYSLPSIFYSGPFNNDLDDEKYIPFRNEEGHNLYGTQALFEYLDGKKEFPYDILRKYYTFGQTLSRFRNKSY